jgi:hypothetical protein
VLTSYSFRWSSRSGDTKIVGDAVPEDRLHEGWFQVLRLALLSGWTPPRWWQWWRWNDHPRSVVPPADVVASHKATFKI